MAAGGEAPLGKAHIGVNKRDNLEGSTLSKLYSCLRGVPSPGEGVTWMPFSRSFLRSVTISM